MTSHVNAPSEKYFVPVEELMAVTGLGPIQLRRDIKDGHLPGSVRRSTVYVLWPEWKAYLANEWTPAPTRKPVQLHSVREKAS